MSRSVSILLALLFAASGADAANRVLTQTDELRQIVRSGRREGWNFNVSGKVVAVLPNNRIVVEDDAGRFCFFNCRTDELPKDGDVVGVRGYIINANTRRDELLTDGDVRIERGSGGRPVRPLDIPASRLTDPSVEMRKIRITGVLVTAAADETDPRWEILQIKSGAQSVLAFFYRSDAVPGPTPHAPLAGARISVTGICFHHLSGTRRFIGPYVEVTSEKDIVALAPPPADPFNVPPLETFGSFNAEEITAMDRRQVVGSVLATWLPNGACLAEDDGNPVTVSFAEATPLPQVGTRVRVCGYPDTDLYTIRLALAQWRAEGGEVHAPEPANPNDIAQIFLDRQPGSVRSKAALHGKLLSLEGTVSDLPADLHAAGRYRLATANGTVTFDTSTRPEAAAGISLGSQIRVTGLCLYETEERSPRNPLPKLKDILLVVRAADDVAVLAPPPWWTIRRLFALVCLLALVAGALFVRTSLLKRRTRLRVEERTRLAVELHDSLSQNLAAAAFEVSAARAAQACDPPGAERHLDTADRMLRSSRTQLKQCLWDLRSDTLAESDFSKSVLKTVLTVAEDAAVHVRFNVSRAHLDDPTAHTVLSILRELVSNAVRHGAAKSVRIAGDFTDGQISFSVTDDGRGFDAAHAAGPAEGHFGLTGIRERLRAHGGTLTFAANPKGGMRALVRLTPSAAGERNS